MTGATGSDSSADWLKSEGEGSQIATGKMEKGDLSEKRSYWEEKQRVRWG